MYFCIIFVMFYLLILHLFELCIQAKNESDISAMENSYCAAMSEQTPESRHSFRSDAAATMFGQRHNKTMNVLDSEVIQLAAGNSVCLSPDTDSTSAAHWLNHSLPAQSCRRVYSEDGTPAGSTCLQRGRPNSLKSGLPSPLQRSLLVSTGLPDPVVSAKEVAVIDTSPILSTYCVTSAVCESSEHTAAVLDDRNGSTLVNSGLKVSPNAQIETTLDDSTHNQAFTESMLADPNLVDSNLVDVADASYTDTVDCDKDAITCNEMSQLSLPLLSQSPLGQLLNPPVSSYSDPALKPIQNSTTSLDSAIDAENIDMNESRLASEVNILRSYSKQSIISHDSGVGLADPHHSADTVSPKIDSTQFSHEGSHCIRRSSSVQRQSVRFTSNLQVSTDVRNFISKAGMPLVAVSDEENENDDAKLQCSTGVEAVVSEREHVLESHTSQRCCVNLSSSTTVSRRQSKLVPVLPISTNLVRVSSEHYSESAKRYITNSSTVAGSPAVSAGPPRIKSALLTPSFKQCLSGVDGTSQLRSRFRGKPAKRLQSSPYRNHSPVNPLSPRHVNASGHTTVTVPFDIDV